MRGSFLEPFGIWQFLSPFPAVSSDESLACPACQMLDRMTQEDEAGDPATCGHGGFLGNQTLASQQQKRGFRWSEDKTNMATWTIPSAHVTLDHDLTRNSAE